MGLSVSVFAKALFFYSSSSSSLMYDDESNDAIDINHKRIRERRHTHTKKKLVLCVQEASPNEIRFQELCGLKCYDTQGGCMCVC